ncbi:MAG: hypothetical protein LBF16_10785 [Pseudomonadales bacterium]|jgi:hypothetical protein|nr:hypothetical protein [Pseudomonadales bacterium]
MSIVHAAVFGIALVGFFFILRSILRPKAETDLRSAFEPEAQFIGKSIEYMIGKVGATTSFGSMDHGQDVAQWKAGNLLVEAWFQDRICTSVEIRPCKN